MTTEIRVEAFNVLNHPQFANPNTTIGNAAVRHDLGDVVEPVVLALRHGRAAGAAGDQGPLLATDHTEHTGTGHVLKRVARRKPL